MENKKQLIKSELKHREKLIDVYYDSIDIYELKRAMVKYFSKLNQILDKLEKI